VERGNRVATAPLALPNHLAGFSLTETEEFEEPELGVRMRYATPSGLWADVFLYPIVPAALARSRAGRDTAAFREFERARADIASSLAHRGETAPEPLSEAALHLPAEAGHTARGHRVSLSYHRDGIDWYSHLYVIAAQDRYVKVRASHPQAKGTPESPPPLDDFVQALFKAVISGYGKEPAGPPLPRA
jgi:hypothetical protein